MRYRPVTGPPIVFVFAAFAGEPARGGLGAAVPPAWPCIPYRHGHPALAGRALPVLPHVAQVLAVVGDKLDHIRPRHQRRAGQAPGAGQVLQRQFFPDPPLRVVEGALRLANYLDGIVAVHGPACHRVSLR